MILMNAIKKVPLWANFLRQIRSFLNERDFLEVTTNHLVSAGAFENTIDTLKVSYQDGCGELHSSPEIEMKSVLTATRLPIFQICQCFRDDLPSDTHSREFTMLEFYRLDCDFRTIQQDMKNLIVFLSGQELSFEQYSIDELVKNKTGIDITAAKTVSQLSNEVREKQLFTPTTEDSWEDVFFKLMLDHVEPKLNHDIPTIVYHYPPSLAALSKLNADRSHAERFEIYWKGMEICNGCTELSDVEELEKRIQVEAQLREMQAKPPHPIPKRLVEIMRQGLPPSAGVAVGLNRLFKCLYKA